MSAVGAVREARTAGNTPASAPTAMVTNTPENSTAGGMETAQPLDRAAMAVTSQPSSVPASPPSAESSIASKRNCHRTCRRVAPNARRNPISLRRSSTEMTMVFATPIPPTSSAIEPTPTSNPVNAWSTVFLAASASEGRETLTEVGACGLMVGGSSSRTAATRSSEERSKIIVGVPV